MFVDAVIFLSLYDRVHMADYGSISLFCFCCCWWPCQCCYGSQGSTEKGCCCKPLHRLLRFTVHEIRLAKSHDVAVKETGCEQVEFRSKMEASALRPHAILFPGTQGEQRWHHCFVEILACPQVTQVHNDSGASGAQVHGQHMSALVASHS